MDRLLLSSPTLKLFNFRIPDWSQANPLLFLLQRLSRNELVVYSPELEALKKELWKKWSKHLTIATFFLYLSQSYGSTTEIFILCPQPLGWIWSNITLEVLTLPKNLSHSIYKTARKSSPHGMKM
jgi:hypothetical protein